MSHHVHQEINIAQHPHDIRHKSHRAPYVRAALMGANDGLVSTASFLLGVSASGVTQSEMVIIGFTALIAGSLSMFVGEYVSMSSQRDAEKADIALERRQHRADGDFELQELTNIYVQRGLNQQLAQQVATELSRNDPLRHHVRDELGIDIDNLSKPWKAAFASGASFCVGSGIPLVTAIVIPNAMIRMISIAVVSILTFTLFGVVSATLGGASKWRACARIIIFGIFALSLTYLIGMFARQMFGQSN